MKLYKLETWVEVADDVDSSVLWSALRIANREWDGAVRIAVPWDDRPAGVEARLPDLTLIKEVVK